MPRTPGLYILAHTRAVQRRTIALSNYASAFAALLSLQVTVSMLTSILVCQPKMTRNISSSQSVCSHGCSQSIFTEALLVLLCLQHWSEYGSFILETNWCPMYPVWNLKPYCPALLLSWMFFNNHSQFWGGLFHLMAAAGYYAGGYPINAYTESSVPMSPSGQCLALKIISLQTGELIGRPVGFSWPF